MVKSIKIFLLLTTFTRLIQAQELPTRIISSDNMTSKEEIWNLLGLGISNFEVDLMYIYGDLFVTSTMPDSANHLTPTLSDAYLFPLFSNFKKNGNSLANGDSRESFILLNIHNEFKKTNKTLKAIISPLRDLISYDNGSWHEGKIRFLVKNKDFENEITRDGFTCIGLVGNKLDIESELDSHQMPLIELDFNELTNWSGVGNIPFPDYVKIKELVNKVHQKNRKLSIINCPTHKTAWEALASSKVDFINTNDPLNVSNFLNERK